MHHSTVQWSVSAEDLREVRLCGQDDGPERGLPQPAGLLPDAQHLLLQCGGGLLDPPRAPPLPGPPVHPAARPLQPSQRLGQHHYQRGLRTPRHRAQTDPVKALARAAPGPEVSSGGLKVV